MITKETARKIYNCYQQLESIKGTKQEMLEEVQKIQKREENCSEPIPESPFGKFGKGMQLGVPNGVCGSMRIFDISPELALSVMNEQSEKLNKELRELETIAKLELSI